MPRLMPPGCVAPRSSVADAPDRVSEPYLIVHSIVHLIVQLWLLYRVVPRSSVTDAPGWVAEPHVIMQSAKAPYMPRYVAIGVV